MWKNVSKVKSNKIIARLLGTSEYCAKIGPLLYTHCITTIRDIRILPLSQYKSLRRIQYNMKYPVEVSIHNQYRIVFPQLVEATL